LEDQKTPKPLLVRVPILRAEVFKKRGESEKFSEALDGARSYYRRLYNENPNALLAAAALGKIASTYLLESQPYKAIETLSELKDEQGRFPSPVMLRIGQIYLDHARDYRAAETAFSRYLDLYPNSDEAVLAQLGLGLSLFQEREYKKAADEFLSVEQNYPRKWQQISKARFLYAQCFEKMGDWQRALTEFNWVKANFPATPEGLEVPYYIAQYYEKSGEKKLAQDSFDKGIEFYRKIVDTYSRTSIAPIAQNYIAKSLLALGRWQEAAESFKAVALRFPGSQLATASLLAAADIYRVKLNDKTAAANSLREYIAKFPHYPQADELRREIESLEA
jgi:TolA-binding protein